MGDFDCQRCGTKREIRGGVDRCPMCGPLNAKPATVAERFPTKTPEQLKAESAVRTVPHWVPQPMVEAAVKPRGKK